MKKKYKIGEKFNFFGVELVTEISFQGCTRCEGCGNDDKCVLLPDCADGVIFKRMTQFKTKQQLDEDFADTVVAAAKSFKDDGIISGFISRDFVECGDVKKEVITIHVERYAK